MSDKLISEMVDFFEKDLTRDEQEVITKVVLEREQSTLFDKKQEWYKKLLKKLNRIDQGEMTVHEYMKEVESKIVDKTV